MRNLVRNGVRHGVRIGARLFWFVLAVLFLVEAWLWSHLQPLVAALIKFVAWDRLRAQAAATIEELPPYATLLVFLIPMLLLFPIKLLGLWMLAHGSYVGAMATLGLAKVVSMGFTAFIFDVTRPKLLQLPWFRYLHDRVLIGLAWAHRQVDPIKARLRAALAEQTARVRVMLAKPLRRIHALARAMSGGRGSRFLRHAMRLRRRMRQEHTAPPPPAPEMP